jgi:hypothetical protein
VLYCEVWGETRTVELATEARREDVNAENERERRC